VSEEERVREDDIHEEEESTLVAIFLCYIFIHKVSSSVNLTSLVKIVASIAIISG
jgi:hypothetical protein